MSADDESSRWSIGHAGDWSYAGEMPVFCFIFHGWFGSFLFLTPFLWLLVPSAPIVAGIVIGAGLFALAQRRRRLGGGDLVRAFRRLVGPRYRPPRRRPPLFRASVQPRLDRFRQ